MVIIIIIIIIIMFIPCRLRQDVRPGLQSLGAGYNKSLRVPGLSFPSSYRDSTLLSERYPESSIRLGTAKILRKVLSLLLLSLLLLLLTISSGTFI